MERVIHLETKKILFGFSDEKFEKTLSGLLRCVDYETEIYARTSKIAINDAFKKVDKELEEAMGPYGNSLNGLL